MKYWCKKETGFTHDPSCNHCEVRFCYAKWLRKGRSNARLQTELKRIGRLAAPLRDYKGKDISSQPRPFDFLLGLIYLPGFVMLFWIPFLFLLANPPVFLFTWKSLIFFIICLIMSSGIHELGHIIVAKSSGVEIEEWRFVPVGIGFKLEGDVDFHTTLKILGGGPLANLLTAVGCVLFSEIPLIYFLLLSSLLLFLINSLPKWGVDGLKVGLELSESSKLYTYLYAFSFPLSVPFLVLLILYLF